MRSIALYGVSRYGADQYGYDIPPAYRVDPFLAVPVNYSTVQVSWNQPSGNISAYRLIKNRYGFPVDQDDGVLLIDSLNYPGNQYADTNLIPGTYQYYAFYVLLDFVSNSWVRAGFAACLVPVNYGSGLEISTLIPEIYATSDVAESSSSNFPSTTLDNFCQVLGWGSDYLKTQYDTYLHVNDPWKISLNDLYNLASQLGININPDIHPFTLRKAVYSSASVNHNRGTTSGLSQELSALTGWSSDLQISQNFMLENDQSAFLDPVFTPWSANIAYNVNEYVSYQNYWYQCKATGNIGVSPTGANTSNTYWNPVVSSDNNTFLSNPATGNLNTWELLYPNASNGIPSANSFYEELGVSNPANTSSFTYNSLKAYNKSGSTATLWLRSISRSTGDTATVTSVFAPNKDQVVGDGIPVPFLNPSSVWNYTTWSPSVRYGTGQVISYKAQPFMASRASTNVIPSYSSRAGSNNSWMPVSLDQRFRICISAYISGSVSGMTATPFVEWYDAGGNFISRVFARNATSGLVSLPGGLYYDSFTSGAGSAVNNRTSDDGQGTWAQQLGTFLVSPDNEGSVYPSNSAARTYATINSGTSNCQVGVTFISNPASGFATGLILRWQDDNNYIFASMTGISVKQNGTFTSLGNYSVPANLGDRLVVQLNGTSIIAFINNVQVLSVSSSLNQAGTIHGIINDQAGSSSGSGYIIVTNPGPQSSVTNQPI